MTKKPHKRNEDNRSNRSIVLKHIKQYYELGQTDRRTYGQFNFIMPPKQKFWGHKKTRTGSKGDKNTPKPGHGHSINTDKPKQNSFSNITIKSIEFSFRKSITNRILAKSKSHNSAMT